MQRNTKTNPQRHTKMNSARKKIYLVTGAAGFIGSRWVEFCNQKHISIISVDRLDLFESRPENQGLAFGEKVDLHHLFDWLDQTNPHIDAIVHLGAITDTRESDQAKLDDLNLGYSQRIWTYATQHKIPLIYASSAATYGDGQLGYTDDETQIPQLHALNLYGDSKQKFDLWALEQERRNFCPPQWSGFKFFNVYGFGESHKEFMSSVVLHAYHQIEKNQQVTLFKSHKTGIPDGHQKRDFIFIDDILKVLHFALEKPIQRGIFNLGTGQARTFLDLARGVFAATHHPEKIRFVDTPELIRDKYQYFTQASMDKLRAEGYKEPFTSLEEGIAHYLKRLHSFKLTSSPL